MCINKNNRSTNLCSPKYPKTVDSVIAGRPSVGYLSNPREKKVGSRSKKSVIILIRRRRVFYFPGKSERWLRSPSMFAGQSERKVFREGPRVNRGTQCDTSWEERMFLFLFNRCIHIGFIHRSS